MQYLRTVEANYMSLEYGVDVMKNAKYKGYLNDRTGHNPSNRLTVCHSESRIQIEESCVDRITHAGSH
jgi:hypothetical protein